MLKFELWSNAMEPTVNPAAPESVVIVRVVVLGGVTAVGLLKMAAAPMAFGTSMVSQFVPTAQLPPAPGTQISACTEQLKRAAAPAKSQAGFLKR